MFTLTTIDGVDAGCVHHLHIEKNYAIRPWLQSITSLSQLIAFSSSCTHLKESFMWGTKQASPSHITGVMGLWCGTRRHLQNGPVSSSSERVSAQLQHKLGNWLKKEIARCSYNSTEFSISFVKANKLHVDDKNHFSVAFPTHSQTKCSSICTVLVPSFSHTISCRHWHFRRG